MIPRLHTSFLTIPLAHRALHNVNEGRPENSRAAIRAALQAGYGVEIDVQMSADGEAMVFHDYALDRLTHNSGAVRQRSAHDLRTVRLAGSDEGIPDLAEVLELIAGRVPVLIELKDQDGAMGPDVGPLEDAVAQIVSEYPGPVGVMSFNPHSVNALKSALPHVPRGIVTSAYTYDDWPLSVETCDRLRDIPDYDRVEASFISHECKDLNRPRVRQLRAHGADVLCWTVTSQEQERVAREYAQNITFEQYLAPFPA